MRIASFDIGLKTCSVCVEEYKIDPSLTPPPSKDRYIKKIMCATPPMETFVRSIAKCGRLLYLEKRELGDKKAFHAGFAFLNLYTWLAELDVHLKDCDMILIEQQMQTNPMALTLMHHLYAYLLIKFIHTGETKVCTTYGSTAASPEPHPVYTNNFTGEKTDSKPAIKLYQSKNKTRVLGAPLKIAEDDIKGTKLVSVTKYQRKKWSTEQASEILVARGDTVWHDYIFKLNKKKKDDLSDVIMQNLSYIVKRICNEEEDDTEE